MSTSVRRARCWRASSTSAPTTGRGPGWRLPMLDAFGHSSCSHRPAAGVRLDRRDHQAPGGQLRGPARSVVARGQLAPHAPRNGDLRVDLAGVVSARGPTSPAVSGAMSATDHMSTWSAAFPWGSPTIAKDHAALAPKTTWLRDASVTTDEEDRRREALRERRDGGRRGPPRAAAGAMEPAGRA